MLFSALFSFPYLIRYFTSDPEHTVKQAALEAEGWSVTGRYYENGLSKYYSKNDLPVSISSPVRKGDFVTIEMTINNKSEQIYTVSGKLISPAESKDLQSDSWFHDLVTFPGDSKKKVLKTFLPSSYERQMLFVEINFWLDGNLITFKKNVLLPRAQTNH